MKDKKIIITILLLIVGIFIFVSFAKYVSNKTQTHAIESSEFYFESSMASTGAGSTYTLDWDGENEKRIEFNITNYIDVLQKTNEDIKYKITVTPSDTSKIQSKIYEKNSNTEVIGTQELTIAGGGLNQNNYILSITPKVANLTGEYSVEININSTSPYTKQLKTTIQIEISEDKEYEANLVDFEEYVILHLKTNTISEAIDIEYLNTKLELDMSNNLVNNLSITTNSNINSFTIPTGSLENNNFYEVIFIKKNSSDTIQIGTDIIV